MHMAMRAISMVMTIVYTFLLTGACSVQPAREEIAVQAPQENIPLGASGTVLRIFQSRAEIGYELQKVADQYMAGRPDVRIQIQTMESESDYRVVLRGRLSSENAVDLFQVMGRQDAWELYDSLLDLSMLNWVGQAEAGLAEALRFDEGYFGIPYSIEGTGLIANQNIFEAADIPLAGISDMEDLADAFAELDRQIKSGEMLERFSALEAVTEFPAQDKTYIAEKIAPVLLAGEQADIAEIASAKFVPFHTDPSVELFVRLLAGYSMGGGGFERLLEVPQNRQVEQGIATGRIAVALQDVEIYRKIERVTPGLADRLRLLPVPIEGAQTTGVYVSSPVYWVVNAGSSDNSKAAAIDFLAWLYHSEEGSRVLAQEMKVLSPYRQTAPEPQVYLHRQLLRYIQDDRFLSNPGREYPGNWGNSSLAVLLQQYLQGETSWEEVMILSGEEWHRQRR